MDVANEQYKHLRRPSPPEVPLTRTLRWMEDLPSHVRPTALLRLHARIVNLIAATWRDPKAFDAYMDSLLRDTRGNRRGFPPEIALELISLKHFYDTRGPDDNIISWQRTSVSVGHVEATVKGQSGRGARGSNLHVVSRETLTPELTEEQLECLKRCAKGISLRFEASEIVDVLVAGGYATEGVARVVTVTARGLRYLQTHTS